MTGSKMQRATRVARLLLAAAVLPVLLLAHRHFRLTLVIGESMSPVLHTGDVLLVRKTAFENLEPQRGDIVLAEYDHDLIVKRVVGLPGEEVELRRGHLYINGAAVPERHTIQTGVTDIRPGRLFQGRFALLGDNRAIPLSQLVHAVVSKDEILGKVVWSFHFLRRTEAERTG